jgi:hypothetical protein
MSTNILDSYKKALGDLLKEKKELESRLAEIGKVLSGIGRGEKGNLSGGGRRPGRPPGSGKGPTAKDQRVGNGKITIQTILGAISHGFTNNKAIAKALKCSPITVANKVKAEGKDHGIKSEGNRRTFKYVLK